MRFVKSFAFVLAAVGMTACATTEPSQRIAGLSPDAQKAVEESGQMSTTGDKASLDASVDKYRTVTLTDEKTGKPRVICKRIRRPGTLFETKICSTKEEWDLARQEAKDQTDGIQRNMDARCAAAGC